MRCAYSGGIRAGSAVCAICCNRVTTRRAVLASQTSLAAASRRRPKSLGKFACGAHGTICLVFAAMCLQVFASPTPLAISIALLSFELPWITGETQIERRSRVASIAGAVFYVV